MRKSWYTVSNTVSEGQSSQLDFHIHVPAKTVRQTDKWTDRQSDRQMDRQTDRQIDGQTDSHRTDRWTDRQTDRFNLKLNYCDLTRMEISVLRGQTP